MAIEHHPYFNRGITRVEWQRVGKMDSIWRVELGKCLASLSMFFLVPISRGFDVYIYSSTWYPTDPIALQIKHPWTSVPNISSYHPLTMVLWCFIWTGDGIVDLLLKMLMLMMMFLEVTMRAMIAVRRAGGNWHVGCDWGYIYKIYIQIIPMIYIYIYI